VVHEPAAVPVPGSRPARVPPGLRMHAGTAAR